MCVCYGFVKKKKSQPLYFFTKSMNFLFVNLFIFTFTTSFLLLSVGFFLFSFQIT